MIYVFVFLRLQVVVVRILDESKILDLNSRFLLCRFLVRLVLNEYCLSILVRKFLLWQCFLFFGLITYFQAALTIDWFGSNQALVKNALNLCSPIVFFTACLTLLFLQFSDEICRNWLEDFEILRKHLDCVSFAERHQNRASVDHRVGIQLVGSLPRVEMQ